MPNESPAQISRTFHVRKNSSFEIQDFGIRKLPKASERRPAQDIRSEENIRDNLQMRGIERSRPSTTRRQAYPRKMAKTNWTLSEDLSGEQGMQKKLAALKQRPGTKLLLEITRQVSNRGAQELDEEHQLQLDRSAVVNRASGPFLQRHTQFTPHGTDQMTKVATELTPDDNAIINQRASELAKSTSKDEMHNIVTRMDARLRASLQQKGIDPIIYHFRMLGTTEFRLRQNEIRLRQNEFRLRQIQMGNLRNTAMLNSGAQLNRNTIMANSNQSRDAGIKLMMESSDGSDSEKLDSSRERRVAHKRRRSPDSIHIHNRLLVPGQFPAEVQRTNDEKRHSSKRRHVTPGSRYSTDNIIINSRLSVPESPVQRQAQQYRMPVNKPNKLQLLQQFIAPVKTNAEHEPQAEIAASAGVIDWDQLFHVQRESEGSESDSSAETLIQQLKSRSLEIDTLHTKTSRKLVTSTYIPSYQRRAPPIVPMVSHRHASKIEKS